MNFGRLTIRHVACLGPGKKDAVVDFKAGPNAIIGLSDTGKSFVFELIDFMLGAEELKRELPEAAGYDTIVMGIETAHKKLLTLRRSMSGSDMHALDGLVISRTGETVVETLVAAERKKGPRTINQFYLDILGLSGMVLLSRKEKGTTQRLSIRTLSKLVLVSETRIIEQQSPILSGQFTLATPEMSLFRLLVSGVDDSALISYASETKTVEDKQDRLAAGRALVAERLKQLEADGHDESAFRSELAGFEETLAKLRQDTGSAEQDLVAIRRRVRRLADAQEIAEQREGELSGLLTRFALLDAHYQSDMERLTAIAEAAEALDSLAPGPCPASVARPPKRTTTPRCAKQTFQLSPRPPAPRQTASESSATISR